MEKQITNEEITPAIVCVRILTDSGSLGYFTPLVFFLFLNMQYWFWILYRLFVMCALKVFYNADNFSLFSNYWLGNPQCGGT